MPPASTESAAAPSGDLVRENARLRGDLLTLSRRISHDLRTPLAGIGMACTALGESDGGKNPLSAGILESVDEIAGLIERVSFVVKASTASETMERVPMAEVVWAALQRQERKLQQSGGAVTHPSEWPTVTGIAAWSEAIWTNLIANAVRHGGPAPKIELGWSAEAGAYLFWIEDRGPGVAEKHAAMLFEPFENLHRINAPRGLGLSIVHRLVTLQGGRCGYAPRAGGGARFFFTLPA